MSKRQNSHSVRAAALCCSQRARNVISPLSPLGRIARIADSNCPSRLEAKALIEQGFEPASDIGPVKRACVSRCPDGRQTGSLSEPPLLGGCLRWRKISVTLTDPAKGVLSEKGYFLVDHSSRVANGHLLPRCPDSSCSLRRPMAKRSARTAASLSSGVRVRLVASLRMSDRCCSSSSLVRHSVLFLQSRHLAL